MRLQSQRWGSHKGQMKGGQRRDREFSGQILWRISRIQTPFSMFQKKIVASFLVQGKGSWSFSSFDQVLTFAHGNPAVFIWPVTSKVRFLPAYQHLAAAPYTSPGAWWCTYTLGTIGATWKWILWKLTVEKHFQRIKELCSVLMHRKNNQYFTECQLCFSWFALVGVSRRPESFWRSTLPNDTLLRRHSILNPDGGGDPGNKIQVDQFVDLLHQFFGKSGLFQYVFTDEVYRKNLTYDIWQDFEREQYSFKSCFGRISWYDFWLDKHQVPDAKFVWSRFGISSRSVAWTRHQRIGHAETLNQAERLQSSGNFREEMRPPKYILILLMV